MTIHLPTGTTVRLEERDGNTLVILDHPDAPDDMRNVEAGRVIEGAFQQPFISMLGFGMMPDVLRTIADLIEESPSSWRCGKCEGGNLPNHFRTCKHRKEAN